jgi:predicted secreted protein
MIAHATYSSSRRHPAVAASAAVIATLLALPALGAPASPPADDGLTVLHLSESADRAIRRDRLHVQLRVETTAANAKQVQADINKRMASALAKVKAVPGIKPETGGYSVYEERQQNVPSRWRGSQSLSLVDQDFAELLALVGDLQSDGLAVSSLAFELSPGAARAAQDELTNEALNRLRERAERIAMELHLSFQRYRDIRVGNVGGDRPVPFRAMAMAADAKQAAPPVGEAGDATVQVSVDAEIVLGPDDSKGP